MYISQCNVLFACVLSFDAMSQVFQNVFKQRAKTIDIMNIKYYYVIEISYLTTHTNEFINGKQRSSTPLQRLVSGLSWKHNCTTTCQFKGEFCESHFVEIWHVIFIYIIRLMMSFILLVLCSAKERETCCLCD